MFSIGNNELKEAPPLCKTIACYQCGGVHEIVYGKKVLPDGTEVESKLLAFYRCGGKTYLVGIDGKDIRGAR